MQRETIPHASDGERQDRLRAAVAASLDGSGYAALSWIGCEVSGDRVILQGSVPTFHLKQLAQVFAQRVAEGARVDNRLSVRRQAVARWPGPSDAWLPT
jgi:osmotically-inducible protein OsmY